MTVPALAIDPFSPAFLADPYGHHPALRDAGPLVWLDAIQCYGMARHADVQPALKDWETYISGRGVGLLDFAAGTPWRPQSLLLEVDPPLHSRTRTLMNKVVSLASLKAWRAEWQVKAEALVEKLVARRRFDAVRDLAEAFPLSVFPPLIGLRDGGEAHLLTYGATAFNAFGPRNAVYEQAIAGAGPATEWVNISCRRDHLAPGGWGQSVYAAADRGECSEEEAMRLVRSFLTAGVDTTVNGIANMMRAFSSFPDQWRLLREDPSLAKRAFEESLRWDSTVQTFFRTAARDVKVAGETIPEGAKLLLFLAAANRDPRAWDDPERFDIRRSASGHVGFGFGIHQCLGQMVARMEAEVILNAMIPRIAAIRPDGEPVRRINNTLHALASLPIEVEPA